MKWDCAWTRCSRVYCIFDFYVFKINIVNVLTTQFIAATCWGNVVKSQNNPSTRKKNHSFWPDCDLLD